MRTNILAAAVALSDRDLLAGIGSLVGREREATAELVAHLAALEMRPNLYAAQGYGSLFAYCIEALHLSEDAACNRIDAARTSIRFPVIVDLLAAGSITLTAVRMLKRHLTPENHQAVLARAAHASKEQVELLIAELTPKPDVPASVRKLPVTKSTGGVPEASASLLPLLEPSAVTRTAVTPPNTGAPPAAKSIARSVVRPLAPERYGVQFTIDQDTRDRLRRVQALMRRQIPDGDPAAIFDRALRLLEEAEMKRLGFAKPVRRGRESGRNYENRIRSGTDKTQNTGEPHAVVERRIGPSRHIPAAVKRAVWWRDAGQCAFMSDSGHRCRERSFLELHHIQPYAMEGPATVNNISLRCRRHNQYEGEVVFGPRTSRIGGNLEERLT